MDRELTLKDIVANEYMMEPIITYATLTPYGNWSANMSTIYSKLITDAGRFCEHYSSDIFIDLQYVEKYIQEGNSENKTWLFGIYSSGVDHMAFVLNKRDLREYRALYRLDAVVDGNTMTMTLSRAK